MPTLRRMERFLMFTQVPSEKLKTTQVVSKETITRRQKAVETADDSKLKEERNTRKVM